MVAVVVSVVPTLWVAVDGVSVIDGCETTIPPTITRPASEVEGELANWLRTLPVAMST